MRIWRARALGANLWDIGKINIWQVREIPLVTATLAVKRLPPKAPLVPTGRMEDRAIRARLPVPATGFTKPGAEYTAFSAGLVEKNTTNLEIEAASAAPTAKSAETTYWRL